MIPLPDGFALRPPAAALALLGFLEARRPAWPRAFVAALLGMALFGIAVFLVQAPLQLLFDRVAAQAVSPFWLGANPWFLPLGLALLAGLCQEGLRLLAIVVARQGWPGPLPLLGALVGAAAGGFEAAMVLRAVPTPALHLWSLAVLERVGAVAFHTGAGAALGLGLARGRTGLAFLLVVGLHVATDFTAAALSYGIGSLWAAEAIALLIGLGTYAGALSLSRRGAAAGAAGVSA